MLDATSIPPPRRPDLVLSPHGDGGDYVIKDLLGGAFYKLGVRESFLLLGLDGRQTVGQLCGAFEARFGEALTPEGVQEFLDLAGAQGLLGDSAAPVVAPPVAAPPPPPPAPPVPAKPARTEGGLLFWRKSLFDPDRLFALLAPRLWFFWTPAFVALSAACILTAGALVWVDRQELVSRFDGAFRWETAALLGAVLLASIVLHECAHGLTCKHFGGAVHDVGFLFLFFMPCFYCNVSDAWLFKEKRKRVWVTLAGGWWDLCVWALAVFTWRLTPPDALVNYLAWGILSVCLARTVVNFNPLLKLDGYYLLGALLDLPNLQQRGTARVKAGLRWLLWGGPRPAPEERGRVLVVYGLASWLFGLALLSLMVLALVHLLSSYGGWVGAAAALLFGVWLLSGQFKGVIGSDFAAMLHDRPRRAAVWGVGAVMVPALVLADRWEHRVAGPFRLRASRRAEVCAPVAGFLRSLQCSHGESVEAGQSLLRLEVPGLDSRLAQKRAELREAGARLHLLEIGPRPEEVEAQRQRVERAREWAALARRDLERASRALAADLERLEKQVAQQEAEWVAARDAARRSERLLASGAESSEQYRKVAAASSSRRAQLDQAEAQLRARKAVGTRDAETELVRRQSELAEARAALALLEAGTRPEEIEAEKARHDRLRAELEYLERLDRKTVVRSPQAGTVSTPHLDENVGRYYREGELVCVVEEPGRFEVEIDLDEQDVPCVQPGQPLELKIQGLPFETFAATVERVDPRADPPAPAPGTPPAPRSTVRGNVVISCTLDGGAFNLRPGMTGHARIACGRRPLGAILAERLIRYLRNEFWW